MSSHHMIETPEGVKRIHCTGQDVSAQDAAAAGVTEFDDLGFCGTDDRDPCWSCVDEAIEWETARQYYRALAWSAPKVQDRRSQGATAAYAAEVRAFRRRLLTNHLAKRPAFAR